MRLAFLGIALLLGLASSSPALVIPVLNSDFETFYKPGSSQTVTGTFGPNPAWTSGIGNGVQLTNCCGLPTSNNVQWSDSTTSNIGDRVDVPGWVSTSGFPGLQAGIGVGSSNGIFVNGPGFGTNGGFVQSTSNLGTIQASTQYTLTIQVSDTNGGATSLPVLLDLLDTSGNPILPTTSSSPGVTTAFQTYSRTYAAASLLPYLGESLLIRFGGGNVAGNQTDYDNVSLTAVPEPASLILFGLGAIGLLLAVRRRHGA